MFHLAHPFIFLSQAILTTRNEVYSQVLVYHGITTTHGLVLVFLIEESDVAICLHHNG